MNRSVPQARTLRRTQTTAEAKLWRVVRNRALNGWKVRRQHPIDRYIVDFVCIEAKLIVEVDGATHSKEAEIARDAERTRLIEACGFTLLRITNADIHENRDGVRGAIPAALERRATV